MLNTFLKLLTAVCMDKRYPSFRCPIYYENVKENRLLVMVMPSISVTR